MTITMRLPRISTSLAMGVCGPALVWALPGLTANAQTTEASSEAIRKLEPVVVTSQKREQSLQDVPISVTVFNDAFFNRTQVETFDELSQFTPNLFIEDAVGDSFVSVGIRGIASDPLNQGIEPSVAVIVDGVYQARPLALNADIVGVDRVEVLRGPQGTLFGKNATAGLINITTTRPTKELSGFADVLYGNYNQTRIRASISGPITDAIGFHISGFANERDSYSEALQPNIGENTFNRYGINAKISYDPNGAFDLLLNAGYNRTSSSQQNTSDLYIVDPASGLAAAFSALQAFGLTDAQLLDDPIYDRVNNQDFPGFNAMDRWYASAETNYDFGNMTLTLITAYSAFDDSDRIDVDFTSLNGLSGGSDTQQHQFSEEIRLQNAEGSRFEYTLGAFYLSQSVEDFGQNTLFNDFADLLRLQTGGFLDLPDDLQSANTSSLMSDTFAIFGENTYHFNDRLSLLTGLRVDYEERDFDSQQSGELAAIGLSRPLDKFNLDRDEVNIAARAALNYDLSDNIRTYLTASRATKSGSFNVNSVTPSVSPELAAKLGIPVTPIVTQGFLDTLSEDQAEAILRDAFEFEEETATSFEVGLKGRFLDGRLSSNLAAFYTLFDDLQVSTFNGTTFFLDNAASARSYGIEYDINYLATDSLAIFGAFGWNVAEYDSFPGADCTIAQIASTPAGTTCTQDLSGQPLNSAPEFSGSVGFDYLSSAGTLPNGLKFLASGDINFRSSYITGADLDPNTKQDAYAVANARVGLKAMRDTLEISAYVKNLFEEDYLRLTIDQPFFSGNYLGNPGNPRTFGIVVRKDF